MIWAKSLKILYNNPNEKNKFEKRDSKRGWKTFFDSFKIVVAVAIVAPLVKDESIGITPFVFAFLPLFAGVYFINKGAKNE